MKRTLSKLFSIGIVFIMTVVVFSGMNVNADETCPEGLVGYWKFDEGTGDIAYDSSGNKNYGTIHGTQWTDPTLAIGHGVVPDATYYAYHPSVIKEGIIYKMWWSAHDGINNAIYYSTSNDGVSWTGHTLAIDHGVVSDAKNYAYSPSVIKDGSTYKMWWTAWDGLNEHIYYSTSIDGINWGGNTLAIDHGVVPDASIMAGRSSVIKDGDIYKMWWGASSGGTNEHIYYSTSTDGISWSGHTLAIDHGVVPDASIQASFPSVIKDGDIYQMWWGAYDNSHWRIYYSTSTDGIKWNGHNLAIDYGDIPDASEWAFSPSVLKDGDIYKMWLSSGYEDGSKCAIYYSINEGAQWVDGIVGNALDFDGDDDYIGSIGTTSTFSFIHNIGIFTLEAWIKLNDYSSDDYYVILGSTTGSAYKGFSFVYDNRFGISDNQLLLAINNGISGDAIIISTSSDDAITNNEWHHVAVTGDGLKVIFYVDGVADPGSGTMGPKASGDASDVLNIARSPHHSAPYHYEGIIDEVKIWNKALSAEEIQSHYMMIYLEGYWKFDESSGQIAYDSSGNNIDGVVNGATRIDGQVGGALSFDGDDDYVGPIGTTSTFSFIQNSGVFTIQAWIKLDDYTADNYFGIVANEGGSLYKGFFFIYDNNQGFYDNQLRLGLFKGSSGNTVINSKSSVDIITDNEWHHVAVTGDASNIVFYVDGVPDLGSGTMGSKSSGDSTDFLNIGRTPHPGSHVYFKGSIDEVAIWDRTLSTNEILENYNSVISQLPDLSIASEDISFSNPDPRVDETITINAMVHNIGFGVNEDWNIKEDMLTARESPTSAVVNDKIYVIGGWDSHNELNTVEEYDSATNAWITKANLPTPRYAPTSSVIDGKIYVIGGRDYSGTSYSTVELYDPATNTWSTKSSMPTARGFLTSSVVDGKIYVIGGVDSNGNRRDTVEAYDPLSNSWTSKTSMSTARFGLTSSAVNNKIYAIGGGIPYSPVTFNIVEEYDPITDTWTIKTPMPTTRGYLASSVVNDKIYAIGGRDSDEICLTVVEEYDPLSDTWITGFEDMPTERYLLTTSVVDGKVYAIGGTNKDYYGASFNEEYTPRTTVKALVSIYDGDPESVNILIDQENIIIRGTTSEQISIEWTPTTVGIHDIYVKIENVIPCDSDVSNNIASKSLTVRPINAMIDIDPDKLNLKSNGEWVTCYIELPEGYQVKDIDISTIKFNNVVLAEAKPTEISDYDYDGITDLMVKFDRAIVIKILEPGEDVEILITGKINNIEFEGFDYINVIN
jgi:N-acetylneuraminic acid mutarotase